MTAHPLLELKNVERRLKIPDIPLLCGITLKVEKGQTIAILGASGAGKSTLIHLMAGIETPDAGNIELEGSAFSELDEETRTRMRGENIGIVFQSFLLMPSLTALENVMLPLILLGKHAARSRATEALEQVGLSERLNHLPNALSGGEQQRVAIARAFVISPKLLLADEPTGNLDMDTGARIIDLLLDLNKHLRTTLVLVTHDESLSRRCAYRYLLKNGILQEAQP
ncbi:MAG: ATP-binding cassette domain-containing protein [Pseudomonadota bacterium]|nr:ATP-binding cassette domain-containing protein [Pseudomonadota bacterium]